MLAIHPFGESIRNQFLRCERIWPHAPCILPAFELQVLKPPLSPVLVPPVFDDWFQGLEHLKSEMGKCDFDVALIGAGAWSLPLAVHAKSLGRIGIHLGGDTQILFGIKGRRWDQWPAVTQYYNDAWVRPLPQETPDNVSEVERGCYW